MPNRTAFMISKKPPRSKNDSEIKPAPFQFAADAQIVLQGVQKPPSSMSSSKKDISFDLTLLERKRNLVNNEFCSDVKFLVGEQKQEIYAHKLFLMLNSEYFYAMFNGNFKETNEKEIDAMDIEPEIFLEILKFVYCGEVDLAPDNVVDIYIHSEKYIMHELHSQTKKYLEEKLDYENVLSIFSTNRSYELDFVNHYCLDIISKNPLFLFKHEDFYVMDKDSLKKIFGCRKINCTAGQLRTAMLDWKKTHETEDIKELEDLLQLQRSYKCSKLILFGEKVVIGRMEPAPFKFFLDRDTALFGVGIYVDAKLDPKSTISVTVGESSGKQIRSAQVNYNLMERQKTVQIMDILFEEIILQKNISYQINVTFSIRPDDMFGINCTADHSFLTVDTNRSLNQFLLSTNSNTSRYYSFVSHLFYEHPKDDSNDDPMRHFSFNGFKQE